MSINGLCFAGYWHVGTKEEAKDTEDYGLSRILVESGFRTEVRRSTSRVCLLNHVR